MMKAKNWKKKVNRLNSSGIDTINSIHCMKRCLEFENTLANSE